MIYTLIFGTAAGIVVASLFTKQMFNRSPFVSCLATAASTFMGSYVGYYADMAML